VIVIDPQHISLQYIVPCFSSLRWPKLQLRQSTGIPSYCAQNALDLQNGTGEANLTCECQLLDPDPDHGGNGESRTPAYLFQ
jgi:hypothetical protein